MTMIPDQDREFLKNRFGEELQNPVTIVAYTQKAFGLDQPGLECEFCKETEQLLHEVANISDKIRVDVREFTPNDEMVRDMGIDKIPAIILMSDSVKGVRYYGIPGGFEFSSFVEDIIDVSRNATDLSQGARDKVKGLEKDVHIQVFVTPTCPYCPTAVRTAHQMAIENPKIKSDAVEASEFPHLITKYSIDAVPTVVVNEKVQFEGALPDEDFADQIMKAVA